MKETVKFVNGAFMSDKYEVCAYIGNEKKALDVYVTLVSVGNGEHQLPEELIAEFDEITRGTMLSKAYFAMLESDKPVKISVKYRDEADTIEVVDKAFEQAEGEVIFDITPGEVATIKINSLFQFCLRVICNKIRTPQKDKENFIEFKPGQYTINNCEYITAGKKGFPVISEIPDNTTIFIHPGAVINAAFCFENKHNIKITGGGIVSNIDRNYGADVCFDKTPLYGPLRRYAYPAVFIKNNSSDITVEGVTLNCEFRGVVIRNSENITVSDVKVFTNCINADGINMMNARHIKIEDSFIHCHDDGIAVFTSCDSILYLGDEECENPIPVSGDIEVARCAITTPCRPILVGGHATGSKDPHDRVEHFYAHDLVLTNYRYYDVPEIERVKKWSGFLRILSQTEQLISDIRFENIKCIKRTDYEGQPIHIEVRGSSAASYTERGGYRIENMVFENISFQEKTEIDLPSALYCTADSSRDDYCIDNILFKNVTFGKEKMKNNEDFLEIIGTAKNVTVE